MFDVCDKGKWTIAGLIALVAIIGYLAVSLDFSVGVVVGVVACVLLMLFFPTIIELFI